MAASRKKSSVCRFPSRLGSSSRCLLQTFHCRISRETPSSSTPSAENLVLLHFWATAAPSCASQLRLLQKHRADWASRNLRVLCLNLDDPQDAGTVRSFATKEGISLPILLATQEVAGVYNIIYRYLFDRRRDLALPTSFLLNRDAMIVKVYQGTLEPARLLDDVRSVPDTPAGFLQKACL